LSATAPDLTAILARASEKSRKALSGAEDEAEAWLEEVRSGARSGDMECVTCGRGGDLEDNHVAGRRHGDLTVPMCSPCHRWFTERQDLWSAQWRSPLRSLDLDLTLLLLGLHDLLQLKARHVPEGSSGAYLSLAASVREQYARASARLG
jgi:hypothetical protein